MTVSEWADAHRIIPRAAGAEPGRWRTERTPYLREIMDCLSAGSPVRHVVLMKSSQVGGTEVLLNWLAYVMHHAPTSIMIVMPTVSTAEDWSKQRLKNMLEQTPVLRELVPPSRSRDSDNTTLSKAFPAGHLFVAGANSSATLRSKPVQYIALDEIDEYETDLNEQGSPIELAERRTTTFARRKILKISTPTVRGASAIEAAWLEGDRRRYFVPCPHCGHFQTLRIEQLLQDGTYCCEGCSALISEHEKTAMLAAGEWRPEAPEREVRSYHLSALYSPIGLGDTWVEIAQARMKAARDAEYAKTYTNTILGESFESESQKVDATELRERREAWHRRTIPRGGLLMTVGIDVQHNRWSVLICVWGRGETCWFVDWVEIPGDPTREDDWKALDEVVFAPIANACGVPMRADCIAIDSGNWTHEVYGWVRKHQNRNVIAIKGANQPNKPLIGKPTAQDVNWRGKTVRQGVQLWAVGVRTAKDSLFPRLTGDADMDVNQRRCHFPADMPDEFFQQITAERFDLELRRWVKRTAGGRNEAWDCWVYNYAAACHPRVRLHVKREADWVELESKLEPSIGDLFAVPASAPEPQFTTGCKPPTAEGQFFTSEELPTDADEPPPEPAIEPQLATSCQLPAVPVPPPKVNPFAPSDWSFQRR
jgi:phage terminase large subunit GpA-like protein